MVIKLPSNTHPIYDAETLWALHNELLIRAESILGPRSKEKKIYQPQFNEKGPHNRYTPNKDGAFVELGYGARYRWDIATFQLAHEVVHLIKSNYDKANYLEEGVATAFSLEIQNSYDISIRVDDRRYFKAYQLCEKLPFNPLISGKIVRCNVSELNKATSRDLYQLFPEVDYTILTELATIFPDRRMAML